MRKRTSTGQSDAVSPTGTVTIRIERIVAGGAGIGFADGRALLVPLTAPGDVVEVRPQGKGPFGEVVRLLEPGPGRTVPACAHFGTCGGCDLMHLTYEAQVAAKRGIVLDALKRIGGIELDLDLPITPSPREFGVRCRATWHPTPTGRAGYARRASHEIVEIVACPILEPALEAERRELRISADLTGLTDGERVRLSTESDDELTVNVVGERIRASAGTFFQANLQMLEPFVSAVLDAASPKPTDQVWDLYAGVGLFSLPLARRAAEVWSVESDAAASACATVNQLHAGRRNLHVVNARVEDWLASDQERPEVIVADPPRGGLSQPVVRALARRPPERLVYVSCDPATFARDLKIFHQAGLRLVSLTGFDMFPQTSHVELVCLIVPADG